VVMLQAPNVCAVHHDPRPTAGICYADARPRGRPFPEAAAATSGAQRQTAQMG